MLEILKLFFPVIKRIIDRLFPDPAEQAEIQKQLALVESEINARFEESFVKYIEATQPKSDRVYVWANTLIALVRPMLAVFVVVTPIFFPKEWSEFLGRLKDAGVWGAVALAPAWAWILGRDGVRMLVGVVSALTGRPVPVETLPPGVLPQPSPSRSRYEPPDVERNGGRD